MKWSWQRAAFPLAAFPIILTTGCAGLSQFQVSIDSDPQGARVEVNNEYVGKTPTTYAIGGNADRSFNGNWIPGPTIEFVATPPADKSGLYVQKKSFSPSAFFKQGDHIPEKIFFDMRQKPEQTDSGERLHIDSQ